MVDLLGPHIMSLAVKLQPNLFHDIIATCTARQSPTIPSVDITEAIDQVTGTGTRCCTITNKKKIYKDRQTAGRFY